MSKNTYIAQSILAKNESWVASRDVYIQKHNLFTVSKSKFV